MEKKHSYSSSQVKEKYLIPNLLITSDYSRGVAPPTHCSIKKIDSKFGKRERNVLYGNSMTKFDALAGGFPSEESPGFQARDLLRFFMVDLIIIFLLKFLYVQRLIPSLDYYIVLTLLGKSLLAVYLVWLIGSRPNGWQAVGALTVGRIWAWPAGIVLLILAIPALFFFGEYNFNLTARLYGLLGWEYIPSPQDVTIILFTGIMHPWVRYALFAFAALIGPVMEELAFRGMGMNGFARTGGAVWALVATSLLFGLYHFDLARFLPLAGIGFIMGIGRVAGASLWCSILMHVGYNSGLLLWMSGTQPRF